MFAIGLGIGFILGVVFVDIAAVRPAHKLQKEMLGEIDRLTKVILKDPPTNGDADDE